MTDRSFLPFASGDLFVPAPRLDPAARYPTGIGRIRQLAADGSLKAEVETGRSGLISCLVLSPAGVLHALDPQARAIDRFAADGHPLAPLDLGGAYGSMLFDADGNSGDTGGALLGEHLCGPEGPFAGAGRLVRLGPDGTIARCYATETNGGVSGFLGVTHIARAADGATLYHLSETGPHIYGHDLAADRRLGPIYTKADPPPMLFGLALLPDGRLAVATGSAVRLLWPDGARLGDVALPEGRGWANLVVRPGGAGLWALDFFGGRMAELSLPGLDLVRVLDLGNPNGMTSVAEVP